jgi:hypothetical protein
VRFQCFKNLNVKLEKSIKNIKEEMGSKQGHLQCQLTLSTKIEVFTQYLRLRVFVRFVTTNINECGLFLYGFFKNCLSMTKIKNTHLKFITKINEKETKINLSEMRISSRIL